MNIEITVIALGTVVNMLFIKYIKLLLIEINMYMAIFLTPFLSFYTECPQGMTCLGFGLVSFFSSS